MFTVTSIEFRDMGETLRLRSHASMSAEVTSRIGPGQAACEARAPAATGRRRCGARGTSLTCEANPRHRQHQRQSRAEAGAGCLQRPTMRPDHPRLSKATHHHRSKQPSQATTLGRIMPSSGTGAVGRSVAGRRTVQLPVSANEPFPLRASHKTRAVAGDEPVCVGITSTVSVPNG